jgi:hypothetical protein
MKVGRGRTPSPFLWRDDEERVFTRRGGSGGVLAFVAYRQFPPPLCAAARENIAAVLRGHPGAETVSVPALPLVRLKRPLHANTSGKFPGYGVSKTLGEGSITYKKFSSDTTFAAAALAFASVLCYYLSRVKTPSCCV